MNSLEYRTPKGLGLVVFKQGSVGTLVTPGLGAADFTSSNPQPHPLYETIHDQFKDSTLVLTNPHQPLSRDKEREAIDIESQAHDIAHTISSLSTGSQSRHWRLIGHSIGCMSILAALPLLPKDTSIDYIGIAPPTVDSLKDHQERLVDYYSRQGRQPADIHPSKPTIFRSLEDTKIIVTPKYWQSLERYDILRNLDLLNTTQQASFVLISQDSLYRTDARTIKDLNRHATVHTIKGKSHAFNDPAMLPQLSSTLDRL